MRKFLARVVLLFHVTLVSFWLSLFFLPESLFLDKISLQFYLSLLIVGHQFFWGFAIMPWTEKYRMVCFLTTITQLLRGEKISDSKNYDHSFTREVLKVAGVNISHRVSTALSLTVLAIASIRFFL
jgi:hypothetical protein